MSQTADNRAAVQAAGAAPYIEVCDVAFAYRPGTPVLAGLSLRVGRGRLVNLLGPNGSG